MWIGSIRLDVRTEDEPGAGTDDTVVATLLRDGEEIVDLKLTRPDIDDLEEGSLRRYVYPHLKFDAAPDDTFPVPVSPTYGVQFPDGLKGHLALRLFNSSGDMWVKDEVILFVRRLRSDNDSGGPWVEDDEWTFVESFSRDVALSAHPVEGTPTWLLEV